MCGESSDDRLRQRITSQAGLIGGPSVTLHLTQARVPPPSREFVGAPTALAPTAQSGLAQPMPLAASRQPGRVTPFAKALAEIVAAIRSAGRGGQKRQVFARRGVDHRL